LDAQCAIDLELLLGQDLIAPRPAKQLQWPSNRRARSLWSV